MINELSIEDYSGIAAKLKDCLNDENNDDDIDDNGDVNDDDDINDRDDIGDDDDDGDDDDHEHLLIGA